MEYTVQELADLAGITPRTVRYYDEIDLLKPAKINSSGYRIYRIKEIDRLQQILFYKELNIDLDSIKKIINKPDFNELKALKKHRRNLFAEKEKLELLISNVEKTIKAKEKGFTMNDQEKFEGFKKKLIENNEDKYGKEIREKFGEEVVKKSNKKLKNMSKKEYKNSNELEKKFIGILDSAFETGDPAGELAQKAADLHRQWLSFYWDTYSKEAHAGLAKMYVNDERFKSYYDEKNSGRAEFLKEAILIYTGMKN